MENDEQFRFFFVHTHTYSTQTINMSMAMSWQQIDDCSGAKPIRKCSTRFDGNAFVVTDYFGYAILKYCHICNIFSSY